MFAQVLRDVDKVFVVACGTAFHSAMIAKYAIEHWTRIPVEVEMASEFRYRAAPLPPGGLTVVISQSGETADTLAALRYARSQGKHILGVINVPESTMAREADLVLATHAGPEFGVASTKAFTTQLAVLACLSLAIAKARGKLDRARGAALAEALIQVPAHAAQAVIAAAQRDREMVKA